MQLANCACRCIFKIEEKIHCAVLCGVVAVHVQESTLLETTTTESNPINDIKADYFPDKNENIINQEILENEFQQKINQKFRARRFAKKPKRKIGSGLGSSSNSLKLASVLLFFIKILQ